MPIYEFQCKSCGHQFEELVFRATEADDLVCPGCKSKKVHKLMSAFATGGSAELPCAPSASCDPGRTCDPGGFS